MIVALVGPTGVGKTDVALELAAHASIEVVSMDSVQVYRGMDIGSAKPSIEERARLPHHLVDIADPDERFSAASWLGRFDDVIADIRSRKKLPLVVGGTGLYLRALTSGLAELPAADDALRARLALEDVAALHARLTTIDPTSAARIAPRDRVRLVRALEIFEQTGKPQSTHFAEQAQRTHDVRVFVLDLPEPAYTEALRRRTRAMIDAGLVEEARALRARFGDVRPLSAVGYKEALDATITTELAERIVLSTRQFARRQRTWFRKANATPYDRDALLAALR